MNGNLIERSRPVEPSAPLDAAGSQVKQGSLIERFMAVLLPSKDHPDRKLPRARCANPGEWIRPPLTRKEDPT